MGGNVNEQCYREMISELRQYASNARTCGDQIHNYINVCVNGTQGDEIIMDRCQDVSKLENQLSERVCDAALSLANDMEEFINDIIAEREKLANR